MDDFLSHKLRFVGGAVLGITALLVVLFFVTRGNAPFTSELAYVDRSPFGGGSLVPASCESGDWRGSYCGGLLDTITCHMFPTRSYCPVDGFTCSYIIDGVFYRSGSHFYNDCQTQCPGNPSYMYDPWYDPYATACPPLPPAVRVKFSPTDPWGAVYSFSPSSAGPIPQYTPVTLSWSGNGSCIASNSAGISQWAGPKPSSGNESIVYTPTSSAQATVSVTFTLSCSLGGVTESKQTVVNFNTNYTGGGGGGGGGGRGGDLF